MKKIILLSFALCLFILASAQKQAKLPAHLLNIQEKMMPTISGDELPVIISPSNPYLTPKSKKDLGVEIGNTYYDLQGNGDVGNRMMVYPDGGISAVWTFAPSGSTSSYTGRGTGYNHSTDEGANWLPMPTVRIEGSIRTGWPNVGKIGNTELVVSHDFPNSANLCKSTDGGTTWANNPFAVSVKLCWPRMVVTGNTMHVIGQTNTTVPYAGFATGALVYLKSTDGGQNWTDPIIPTGLDTANYTASSPFSDSYSIAGKGDTVAFVYGDGFRTTCLVKSTNNGNTWTYTEILHLPMKKFDTEGNVMYDINGDSQQDNVYDNDGVNFITLDYNGKAHVFFGRQKYTDDGAGANYSYFPYTDGIYYWNEDMGTINYQYKWTMINEVNTYEAIPDTVNFPIITEVVDINNNGVIDLPDNGSNVPFGPYYNSLSSQPNAVITPSGFIYLFYSSLVEGTDGSVGSEHRAFRNVWEIHKLGGSTNNFEWSTPIRIAQDDFTEEVWPCVSPVTTASSGIKYAHLWYQGDGLPGNSLQPNTGNPHGIGENSIFYIKAQIWEGGIDGINVVKSAPIVYPNPASDNVVVKYDITNKTNITVNIYNMIGQQLMTSTQEVAAGEVNIRLNVEKLPQGIYYIKSDIGKQTFTNKLIKK